jgi:hypothetical protein
VHGWNIIRKMGKIPKEAKIRSEVRMVLNPNSYQLTSQILNINKYYGKIDSFLRELSPWW